MSLAIPRTKADGSVRIRAKLHEVKGRRGTTWFYSYNLRRKRVRSHRFKDRELALFEMRKTEDEYEAKTPFQVTTLSRQELDDAQGAFLTLRDNKVEKTLGEIVSWYVAKGPRVQPITVGKAVEKFMGTLNTVDTRPGTIRFYKHHFAEILETFRDRQLAEVTTADYRTFLERRTWGKISRWHYRQVANRLYRWAMKEKPALAAENPVEPLPAMTKKGLRMALNAPAVISPEGAEAWLKAALGTPHLPFVVMSLFAGIRRTELQEFSKLPEGGWSRISFDAGNIDIPPTVGKKGKRVVNMHPTLVAWLQWLQKKGKIGFAARNLNKGLRAIKLTAKEDFNEVIPTAANLARHSYISYSLRLPGASFAAVAMNSGNTEQVIRDHYMDLQVTTKQAQEFWALTPKALKA